MNSTLTGWCTTQNKDRVVVTQHSELSSQDINTTPYSNTHNTLQRLASILGNLITSESVIFGTEPEVTLLQVIPIHPFSVPSSQAKP